MAGFWLPNFGQITESFKKAQEIQQNAQKLQEELDSMEIEGTDADALVSIWMSGNQLPLKVRIDDQLLGKGIEESRELLEANSNHLRLTLERLKIELKW